MTSLHSPHTEVSPALTRQHRLPHEPATTCAQSADDSETLSALALSQQVHLQLGSAKLGLQGPQGFMPVPVSLTPWQLTTAQFAAAQQLAQLLGKLQARAATMPDWLLPLTQQLASSDTVPGEIWRRLNTIRLQHDQNLTIRSRNVMLNRHDFLLDKQGQWRWVESNPIAAGMGPLNSAYLQLRQPTFDASYAYNDATLLQAALLADAAQRMNTPPQSQALMLMVVEANEDNIFDQQMLCDEIARLGVQVVRVTLHQLQQASISPQHQLLWQNQQVNLVYWRTGYNPTAELDDKFWTLRTKLEQTTVAQCPTLRGQLTGSKWFQHQLTALLLTKPELISAQFDFTAAEVALLQHAVMPSYAVSDLTIAEATKLIHQGFWYKNQQEGGGNVARAKAALASLLHRQSADLLMAPIDAKIRNETLLALRQGKVTLTSGHITELGIFALGMEALYGGYLCRTKTAHSSEGGVHRGGAVLDLIRLDDGVALNKPSFTA